MNEQEMYDKVCNPILIRHEKKLDKILIALKGNNGDGEDIGLCEKVRNQDMRITAIEDEHQTIKKTVRRYFRWAGGIVGGWWLLEKAPEIFGWLKNHL